MPTPNRVPSLRRHKPSSRAVVTLNGRDIYVGPWPASLKKAPPESQAEYDRLIAEWLANGRKLPTPPAPVGEPSAYTVGNLLLAFWAHAEKHYRRPDGSPTGEADNFRDALRPLRELYGTLPVSDFSPLKLKAVRAKMVESGLCRSVVNARIGRVVRVFRWGVAEELVPPLVMEGLRAVKGLEQGRTEARESEPVVPVDVAIVEATLPHLRPAVAAIVEAMLLTGARPGEMCAMRAEEIDRSGSVWLYRPKRHKTKHKGRSRTIVIGPRCQELLRPWLRVVCPVCETVGRPARLAWRSGLCGPCADRMEDEGVCGPWPAREAPGDYHLFSPRESREDWYVEKRFKRKSKVQPSQKNRKKAKAKRLPADRYAPGALALAVARAAKLAGVEKWHPNQLRHTHGTIVRQRFGLEAAQTALGHAKADVTQIYAERDLTLATKVATEIG